MINNLFLFVVSLYVEKEKSELLIKKEDLSDKSDTITGDIKEDNSLPIDWKPQEKCYFCVDGKLLTVNEAGELVAESGPVQTTEADLTNNRVRVSCAFLRLIECFIVFYFVRL